MVIEILLFSIIQQSLKVYETQTPGFLSGCDIDFCHFCDPPKPGVKRVNGDLLGSKIAKNCRKTPKTAKNKTLEGFKIGGNGAKLIFCPF